MSFLILDPLCLVPCLWIMLKPDTTRAYKSRAMNEPPSGLGLSIPLRHWSSRQPDESVRAGGDTYGLYYAS